MKGKHNKIKLLYLAKIMREQTDENHKLSTYDVIDELAKYDIEVDRKTVDTDMNNLSDFGMDIIKGQEGRCNVYYCGSREYELAELRLIIDAIASSKFITEKKSKELIKKFEKNVSRYDAKLLERDVIVSGRIRTMNENIFYNIDTIQSAYNNNHRVNFKYFGWDVKKNKAFHHDGATYDISPWGLAWDSENYYMIGYDEKEGKFKHYRVDKMLETRENNNPRTGQEEYTKLDREVYTKNHFRMFGGTKHKVTLVCENRFANVMIDQFGRDIMLQPTDKDHFRTCVDVYVSDQFLGWVIALGTGVKIESPDEVVERMKEIGEMMREMYGGK